MDQLASTTRRRLKGDAPWERRSRAKEYYRRNGSKLKRKVLQGKNIAELSTHL
jgi:hypothetical protein